MPGFLLKENGSIYGEGSPGGGGSGDSILSRILSVSPSSLISYKILGEPLGSTVALDQVLPTRNGTHSNVTLGQPGIDGYTSGLYNGTTSYTNQYNCWAGTTFPSLTGSAFIAFMFAPGEWATATSRYMFNLSADVNNSIRIFHDSPNRITGSYRAGSLTKAVNDTAFGGNYSWLYALVTWDKTAGPSGELKFYTGNSSIFSQAGVTQTGLGVWAGAPALDRCVIGGFTTSPSGQWNGWLSHFALYSTVLTLEQGIYIAGAPPP